MHDFLKGFTKLQIENGVNDWIHKTVHISQPSGDKESCNPGLTISAQFATNRIHNIARKKRNPTK